MPPLAGALLATGVTSGNTGIGLTVGGVAGALIGNQLDTMHKAKSDAKNAAQAAQQQNAAALQTVKDAQAGASANAVASVARRRSAVTQTQFTSPLGLSTQADVTKKILLGE